MTKIPLNIHLDSNLLANLNIYAAQTKCTIAELIEQFCQQGLKLTTDSLSSDSDVRIDKQKDYLLTRVTITEKNVKDILERVSILESKVDVDTDVNEYLQNWQNSLELKIASLVERRVEEILELARSLTEVEQLNQTFAASNVSPNLVCVGKEDHLDDRENTDHDDEPDEILIDFLEP